MSDGSENESSPRRLTMHQVFLRGLAISLPAILTIVILLWILGGINDYIILPTTDLVKVVIAGVVDHSIDPAQRKLVKLTNGPPLKYCGENYLVEEGLDGRFTNEFQQKLDYFKQEFERKQVRQSDDESADPTLADSLDQYFAARSAAAAWLDRRAVQVDDPEIFVPLDGRAVPYVDYAVVARDTPAGEMPTTVRGLYMEYAVRRNVGSAFTLSAFALSLVIVAIYFLGRFVSVRLGSWAIGQVENRLLGRLPVIRNVYGSAKQVTDFLFSEKQVDYRRVVAIEYPRRGIWSLGLVTGEGMLEITTAVGEPCVSVLVPSSPMPVTGYTMCVPRSAVLDLNITVDQAFQFCISCGVLVPKHQKVTPEILQRELTRRLAERMQDNPTDRRTLNLPSARSAGDDSDEDPS